ncbi:MAG: 3-phosphoshikimate 1-carboxyvinyltransferase, partial [Chloroflexota bacterium]|nr:3-phosphoshikimate 1-carboxyvinyltransferase [Chloroflexota bacterium]
TLTVEGCGLNQWKIPNEPLDCRNSGTTLRTLAGALVGTNTPAVLDGSPGLRRRPMGRIVDPLRQMGALIDAADGAAPLRIGKRSGRNPLAGIDYHLPVASAQVKTALLLAALGADSATTLTEPGPSRDHTERMLAQMGVDIAIDAQARSVRLMPPSGPLKPLQFTIPGDISSAAFLIVAALITPGSEITLRGVGLNPTRTGLLDALRAMGAKIDITHAHSTPAAGQVSRFTEPVGDIIASYSPDLHAIEISGERVVRMIDEFPIFAVAATHAEGTTIVGDAEELRHKETDRIHTLAEEFNKLGIPIQEREDGFSIRGGQLYHGTSVSARGDHRLGMALAVLGLGAEEALTIHGAEIINESFPSFFSKLESLGAQRISDD